MLTGEPDIPATIANRIAVDPKTGCWAWTGTCNGNGVPVFTLAGRCLGVRKYLFARLDSANPTGAKWVRCRYKNRGCVNPAHATETAYASTILTEEEIIRMRESYLVYLRAVRTCSVVALAQRFNITRSAAVKILGIAGARNVSFRNIRPELLDDIQRELLLRKPNLARKPR